MLLAAPEVEHEIFLTKIFNEVLAGPANAVLKMVGIKEESRPWDNALPMELLVILVLVVLFSYIRANLSVDKPGALQHMVEEVYNFLKAGAEETGIHHPERYLPMFCTLFFLILFANLIGLVPGFEAPTMSYLMPLGCAVVVFAFYNFHGFRVQGVVNYMKHFAGPIWWMAPLMFVIEIVSHFARPMSLTLRLRANMFAGEQVTNAFIDLTYLFVPVVFMALHVFVSFLQAYIFSLMAIIYVSGSVEEHHEH